MELGEQIESYLLTQRRWVTSTELCERFDINARQLRQVDDQPGLCSGFAISGDKGFKHISIASTAEWLHFKHRLRKHGIRELVRVRNLGKRRHHATKTVKQIIFEKDTGQALLAMEA